VHYPLAWRFRLLRAIHGSGYRANRRLLKAWARAEGGTARYNPLNTTEPWPGATDYNSAGVKNYPTGAAGIAATAATLVNGHYDGIVADFRRRKDHKTARQIVVENAGEFDVWGTGSKLILEVLARM
jgi:hypothetical protein